MTNNPWREENVADDLNPWLRCLNCGRTNRETSYDPTFGVQMTWWYKSAPVGPRLRGHGKCPRCVLATRKERSGWWYMVRKDYQPSVTPWILTEHFRYDRDMNYIGRFVNWSDAIDVAGRMGRYRSAYETPLRYATLNREEVVSTTRRKEVK